MAYFDKPERRAAWEKELFALMQEKEARRSGTYTPPAEQPAQDIAEKDNTPLRERISYIELLQEEQMKSAAVSRRAPEKELQKEVQFEK